MRPQSFDSIGSRQQKGNIRNLSLPGGTIDFWSNDYLGISRQLKNELFPANGSTGSRLISGNSSEAEALEKQLAQFFEAEAALVFNSGYDANLGLFSCIARRNDTIIYDENIHASIRDGIRLSTARSFSFQHNDINDLKKKLQTAKGDVFVAVESLYSMDGDFAPLVELATLANQKPFFLLVDEAHSGGVFGLQGKGLVCELGLEQSVFARLFTFGKAYGTHGAAILGSEELKHYLLNFARSFIYTTALSPSQYEIISKALLLAENIELRTRLQERIKQFREALNNMNFVSVATSPIQIVRHKPQNELLNLHKRMEENDISCKLIMQPTVASGQECIRICLHAFNTEQEVKLLTDLIRE